MKKTEGRKSRDTVPLIKPVLIYIDLGPCRILILYLAMRAMYMESSLLASCAPMGAPALHVLNVIAQRWIPIIACDCRVGCQWKPECQLCYYSILTS
jgi:hypothetical protein